MKNVYLYSNENEVSFDYQPGKCVCIGETDGSLEDFLEWMREDWTERGCDLSIFPTVKPDGNVR